MEKKEKIIDFLDTCNNYVLLLNNQLTSAQNCILDQNGHVLNNGVAQWEEIDFYSNKNKFNNILM